MYAIIETGGKQYRVELGAEIQVDRLDATPGETIQLERVLLVADGDDATIGRPFVEGASVSARVVGQDRGDKIVVFKYKPKARRRVKKGHRAELTTLRIADIAYGGRSAVAEQEKAESRRSRAAADAEKVAAKKASADQALAAKLAAETEKAAADADAEKAAADAEKAAADAEKLAAETEKAAADAEKLAAETEKAAADAEKAAADAEKLAAETEKAAAETDDATTTTKDE